MKFNPQIKTEIADAKVFSASQPRGLIECTEAQTFRSCGEHVCCYKEKILKLASGFQKGTGNLYYCGGIST